MFLFFNGAKMVVSNSQFFDMISVDKLDSTDEYKRENYNKWNVIDNLDGSVSFYYIANTVDKTHYLCNNGFYVFPSLEKENFLFLTQSVKNNLNDL